MSKLVRLLLIVIAFVFVVQLSASEELSPYLKVPAINGTIEEASLQVKEILSVNDFKVIGEYHPAENASLYVIAFTSDELMEVALTVKERGALASILKVGFVQENGNITVSILNPDYLFYAFLRGEVDKNRSQLAKISSKVKEAFTINGEELQPFGGTESIDDLKKYHYMMMMPYFDDPVELNEFTSFEKGVEIIRNNLNTHKGNTVKVYELIFEDKQVAVFGIGLMDKEDGEAYFLPVVGESHVAAMPYEIILQGKEATMLHGKFRFAVFWPELSMGTFMKIVSTPGDVEDFMEALTE